MPAEERCRAVGRGAAAVDVEYLAKSRTLDQRWLGTRAADRGAIETKLRTYGRVRGLVFGAWAEASPDMPWLVHQAAALSVARARLPGARDLEDMIPQVIHALRRR